MTELADAYDEGARAAEGLAAGLRAELATLDAAMARLSASVTAALGKHREA